jgi:hypothetical protein
MVTSICVCTDGRYKERNEKVETNSCQQKDTHRTTQHGIELVGQRQQCSHNQGDQKIPSEHGPAQRISDAGETLAVRNRFRKYARLRVHRSLTPGRDAYLLDAPSVRWFQK